MEEEAARNGVIFARSVHELLMLGEESHTKKENLEIVDEFFMGEYHQKREIIPKYG